MTEIEAVRRSGFIEAPGAIAFEAPTKRSFSERPPNLLVQSSMAMPSTSFLSDGELEAQSRYYDEVCARMNDTTFDCSTTWNFANFKQPSSNYQLYQPAYNYRSNQCINYASEPRTSPSLSYDGLPRYDCPMPVVDQGCPRTYSESNFPGSMESTASPFHTPEHRLQIQRQQTFTQWTDQAASQSSITNDTGFDVNLPAEDEYGFYTTAPYRDDEQVLDSGSSALVAHSSPSLDRTFKTEDDCDEAAPDKGTMPYAKLLEICLRQASDHILALRDIYEWFKRNTDKGKCSDTKGWQNSIRHNLSMNGAFEKVEPPGGDESKKGFLWRLTDEAVRNGVKSTTRFRSKQPNKRGCKSQHPAPQRQASGAKGGHAAKRTRLRRSERLEGKSSPYPGPYERPSNYSRSTPRSSRAADIAPMEQNVSQSEPMASPYFFSLDVTLREPLFAGPLPRVPTPSSAAEDSLPGTPQRGDSQEIVHLLQFNRGQSLFYDSPETGSEPYTPPTLEEMCLDPSPFFENNPLV